VGARTFTLGTLAVVGSLGLAGCAVDVSPETGIPVNISVSEALAVAQERGFEWEVSILEDGAISPGDYEQAYDQYMECQRELGYVFDKPRYLDPVEGQRWQALSMYRGAGEPPLEGMGACDERIFLVEHPYVSTSPKRMEAQLLAKFRECLDDKGITYRGDEVSFNDFTTDVDDEQYRDSESTYTSCLVDSAYELYPDLIAVGYGR
jgi:hypothetical protein